MTHPTRRSMVEKAARELLGGPKIPRRRSAGLLIEILGRGTGEALSPAERADTRWGRSSAGIGEWPRKNGCYRPAQLPTVDPSNSGEIPRPFARPSMLWRFDGIGRYMPIGETAERWGWDNDMAHDAIRAQDP